MKTVYQTIVRRQLQHRFAQGHVKTSEPSDKAVQQIMTVYQTIVRGSRCLAEGHVAAGPARTQMTLTKWHSRCDPKKARWKVRIGKEKYRMANLKEVGLTQK